MADDERGPRFTFALDGLQMAVEEQYTDRVGGEPGQPVRLEVCEGEDGGLEISLEFWNDRDLWETVWWTLKPWEAQALAAILNRWAESKNEPKVEVG